VDQSSTQQLNQTFKEVTQDKLKGSVKLSQGSANIRSRFLGGQDNIDLVIFRSTGQFPDVGFVAVHDNISENIADLFDIDKHGL